MRDVVRIQEEWKMVRRRTIDDERELPVDDTPAIRMVFMTPEEFDQKFMIKEPHD